MVYYGPWYDHVVMPRRDTRRQSFIQITAGIQAR